MYERTAVRALLFSVPALCALQYFVLSTRGEPYPALILPGFPRATEPHEIVYHELRLMRGDELLTTLRTEALMPDTDRSVRQSVIRDKLFHSSKQSPEVREWLLGCARKLDPTTDHVVVRWYALGGKWLGDYSVE